VEPLLAAAEARAEGILRGAEVEASRIRAAASDEVAAARVEAAAAGRAEGLARAAAALALAADVREAKLAELDAAVVEVALDIARRVVGRELAASPDTVVELARRALRAAAGGGDITLRIAPGDAGRLHGADDALRAIVQRGALTIAEDPSLASGEVVVESAGGRVDARVDAQLEQFRRALQAEGT
jgi:flagellar biosynthesis/type III secretory pathway protein FliH